MNNTDSTVIRFAERDDVDRIMAFIRTWWSPSHILATCGDFFRYQHVEGDRVNYVVADPGNGRDLDAVLGFVRYSPGPEPADVCCALWKVREKTGDPLLGIKLLTFLQNQGNCRTFSSCGINLKHFPIYQYLGYRTGRLKHYYRLNDQMTEFRIARVQYRPETRPAGDLSRYRLVPIQTKTEFRRIFDPEQYRTRKPYKDIGYLNHRYYEHPVYRYGVYGIDNNGRIESILVAREIVANEARILRIVDFIGNDRDLEGVGGELAMLMKQNRYEYMDFYAVGIQDDIVQKAGFHLRKDEDTNIIPNYFEPFVPKNIDIQYFTTATKPFYMFKADGDQDRPSII